MLVPTSIVIGRHCIIHIFTFIVRREGARTEVMAAMMVADG